MLKDSKAPALTGRRIWMLELAAVAAAGVTLFFVRFGPAVLNPGRIDWLMARGDPAAYYLVWDFFRYEAWTFPLGRVTQYLYPLGTSFPLVDGLPLLGYPAKLLSPLLPAVFQYYGFWHLVCAVLQAVFGYRIVRRFVPGVAGRLLGALLFLLAPVFLYREGHISLSSHWLLLAAIDCYLSGSDGGWRRLTLRWCALGALVALIHPYLMAMILLFYGGLLLRRDGIESWRWPSRLLTSACVGLTIIVVWWIAGNLDGISSERVQTSGFGYYSLNLNGFINPMGYGKLLPNLPLERGQYEGFAYLGVGWIILALFGLVGLVFRRSVRRQLASHRPLVWILLATFIYALSFKVMWNQTVVVEYIRLSLFDLPTGVFRCSGRFVWPVIYAIMTGLVVLVGRIRLRWCAAGLLAVALVFQVWDLRPLILQRQHFESLEFESDLSDPVWAQAGAQCSGITTIPPFRASLVKRLDFRDICWLAAQNRIPTTAGYTARQSLAARSLADSIRTALTTGTEDPTQLYVFDRPSFIYTVANLDPSYRSAVWDDYLVCYQADWPIEARRGYEVVETLRFDEFLDTRADMILVFAIRDEGSAGLTSADRAALRDIGFDESALRYRSAAAAIVDHGQVVWQTTESSKQVNLELDVGGEVGALRMKRALTVLSAGFDHGNRAQLRLDGKEEGFNGRGFNVLVLSDDQELLEVAWFDTHKGLPGVVLKPVAP